MKQQHTALLLLAVLFFGVTAIAAFAANDPTAPRTLTEISDSTFDPDNWGPQTHEAIAGNITALVMHVLGQTKSWQGYYGNITATITLDDANNFTFYNWSSAEPRGQVYATLASTISWESVYCFDFTNADMNWSTIEAYYGIAFDDVDGVNETYTTTGHPDFEVSSRTMTGCPTSYIFRDDTPQTADFVNVLLHDQTDNTSGWIYTTIIENKSNATGQPADKSCYNGAPCDFQLLVNEDGHGTDTATTTYYFWVELL